MFVIARHASVAALVTLALACASTKAVRPDANAARSPIAATQVSIYRTVRQLPGPYEEVALLDSGGSSDVASEAQMFDSMRATAARLGANAIVLDALSEPTAGARVAASVSRTTSHRKGRALAVYVYPPELATSSAQLSADTSGQAQPAQVQSFASTGDVAVGASSGKNAADTTEIINQREAIRNYEVQLQYRRSRQPLKEVHATSVIGAPRSEDARRQAVDAYRAGKVYRGRHEWDKAESAFREATQLDGSVAEYHAALGSVLLVMGRWVDAEAALSAAVLLDVDNAEYRRLLKQARSH